MIKAIYVHLSSLVSVPLRHIQYCFLNVELTILVAKHTYNDITDEFKHALSSPISWMNGDITVVSIYSR